MRAVFSPEIWRGGVEADSDSAEGTEGDAELAEGLLAALSADLSCRKKLALLKRFL